MSHAYHNELWLLSRKDAERLLELDKELQEKAPIRKPEVALDLALGLYIRYRNVVKRLVICHDQMLQTQKKDLIKRMLHCAIGRMLEYKREIVNLDCSYYQWPDDFLIEMKFSPDDVDVPAPAYRQQEIEKRRVHIEKLLEDAKKPRPVVRERSLSQLASSAELHVESSVSKISRRRRQKTVAASKLQIRKEPSEERIAREARLAMEKALVDSLVLVQAHERARVGRIVGLSAERMHDYRKKLERGSIAPKSTDRRTYENAAKRIQRAWRSHAARKSRARRIERTEEMLGMTVASWRSRETLSLDEENFRRRLQLVPEYAAATEKATNHERARLLRIRGPGLIEDITDEIREWFIVWYNELGYFDAYPSAKLGGSVLIATGQTLTPQEFLLERFRKQQESQKSPKDKSKPAEAKTEQDDKKKKKKTKIVGWKIPETAAFDCFRDANRDFLDNWELWERPGSANGNDRMDLIAEKLCCELQIEMRELVDELMRLELDVLNRALMKDHAGDKKFTIPTMKKEKGKKKRGKRETVDEEVNATKKKKENNNNKNKDNNKNKKDESAEGTEELFGELVREKIIRNYPARRLTDWFGDLSYQNQEARSEGREFKHRLGEMRQVVMDYCVLPLFSREVHQVAPITRSVCICGLPGSGKSFLADAVCTEVGALLLDVSPGVLAGKYVGKRDEKRLLEAIARVSRTYAPSVILADGVEKPWSRKLTAEEKLLRPKRLAKCYPKMVKSIKPGDQILFLGLSTEPYNARGKFARVHDRFLTIPTTDYNTLYSYYSWLLMSHHGVDRNLDVSCLARMSVGIPLKVIRLAVERVLRLQRRMTLATRPLTHEEIMTEVFEYQPPSARVLENFEKFERTTPLGRKRRKKLRAEAAERERKEAERIMKQKQR